MLLAVLGVAGIGLVRAQTTQGATATTPPSAQEQPASAPNNLPPPVSADPTPAEATPQGAAPAPNNAGAPAEQQQSQQQLPTPSPMPQETGAPQPSQPNTQPPAASPQVSPQANPRQMPPQVDAAQPQGAQPSPPQPQDIKMPPAPPPISGGPRPEADRGNGRIKDPFMIPNDIYDALTKLNAPKPTAPTTPTVSADTIDTSKPPEIRWPLRQYKLTGVIWGVSTPKATFMDPNNQMHIYKLKDKIGNGGAVITSIRSGEVVVVEAGVETKIGVGK